MRDSPLVLVCTPYSASRSCSSRRKRRDFCWEIARIKRGIRLDPLRGVIAAPGLGEELTLEAEALRPAAGSRNADPEVGCGAMAEGTCCHRSRDTLA
jgi:hypothetical protein